MTYDDKLWQPLCEIIEILIESQRSSEPRIAALAQLREVMDETGRFPLQPVRGYSVDEALAFSLLDYIRKGRQQLSEKEAEILKKGGKIFTTGKTK